MTVSKISVLCDDSRGCTLAERLDKVPCEIIREINEQRKVDIMFVGEGPGRTEVEDDRPFVGKTGSLLRRCIKLAKKKDLNIAYSNAVRCLPITIDGDIRAPDENEIELCRPFLIRDIEKMDPDIIVALGKSAVRSLLPNHGDPRIRDNHGTWRKEVIAGRERWVFITWHPSYVSRTHSQIPIFYEEIQTACKLAGGWRPKPIWSEYGKSHLLKTVSEVEDYINHLRHDLTKEDMVAVDVETATLGKKFGNKLGMIQFAHEEHEAYVIPVYHNQTPFDPEELQVIEALLRRLFTKKVSFGYWLAHNGKFEQMIIGEHILRNGGKLARTFRNVPMLDTMAFAYLLNENKTINGGEKAYRLKLLARQLLGFNGYDDATLAAREDGSLLDLPLECPFDHGHPEWFPNLTDYGGMDAYVTRRLFNALKEEAEYQHYYQRALDILQHWFSNCFRMLSVMERNGFWANLAHLKMLKNPDESPILKRLYEIDNEVIKTYESAQNLNKKMAKKTSGGHEPLFRPADDDTPWVIDLNKNDHVRAWLVDELKLEAPDKTSTGIPSVGKSFFAEHKGVEEVDLVAERRGLAKLASSYIDQLIEYIDPRFRHEDCQDGRIRADFHLASTVTGRGSASNPNMQQQVRGDSAEKAAIKSIFQAEQPGVQDSFKIDFHKGPPKIQIHKADPVNCLVQLDFMTSEVRWWAILSGCPDLARAFNNGKALRDAYRENPTPELAEKAKLEGDLHRQTASTMYGVAVALVEKVMRTAAKSIVFGWMFGRGDPAIAAQIKKTVEETKELVKQFGDKFPLGRDYLHGLPDVARKQWFVESPIGRRRRFPAYMVEQRDWRAMTKDERRLIGECNRQAMNSPIQSISSDGAFIGAALFSDYIEDHGKENWLIQNVVHDSCVYQVPIVELEESLEVAERMFTTETMDFLTDKWGVRFNCPIEVDFEIGLTWGALKKWDFSQQSLKEIKDSLVA